MNKNRKRSVVTFLLLCAILWTSVRAMATDKVLDTGAAGANQIPLATYFTVLEDPGQKLTLADVQHPAVARQFAAASLEASLDMLSDDESVVFR